MTYGTVQANAIQGSINTFSPNSAVFRNRLINSDMRIDQRNAGASVTNVGSASTYTLDRWFYFASQASKFTVQQNASSVTPPAGFVNYLGITSSSAYTVGSSEIFLLAQHIEGFNTADLNWGTANAKTVTLSFWVRSSLTGTFGGSLRNADSDRSYPFTYSISSANTWEQKTITVAGDTSGTWGTGNGTGIRLAFGLGMGSTFSGTAGAWAGANYISATGATSVVGTNGATFYITGVQLEVGSTATSFDYRPYGTELALCQRYYYVHAKGATSLAVAVGYYANSGNFQTIIKFPTTMRAAPTASIASGTDYYAAGSDLMNSFSATYATPESILLYNLSEASGTTGNANSLLTNNANSSIAFQIEL